MGIYVFFYIIIVHYIADFLCQTHKQAMGKSSSWNLLLMHTAIYSTIWFLACLTYVISITGFDGHLTDDQVRGMLLFPLITFITHTLTDYITSREAKKFFDSDMIQPGMRVVGFDQVLHYVQLCLTFKYLFLV